MPRVPLARAASAGPAGKRLPRRPDRGPRHIHVAGPAER